MSAHDKERDDLIHNAMTVGVMAALLHGPSKKARTKKQLMRAVDRVMNRIGCPVEFITELDGMLAETQMLERMLAASDDTEVIGK